MQNHYIKEAINRITLNETGLDIDELSPVAIVKNVFKHNNKKIIHTGMAFMALSRGNVKSLPENFQTHFTNGIPEKIAYQNDKIFSMTQKKLSSKIHQPPFGEIDSVKNNKFSLLYLLHKYVIKNLVIFKNTLHHIKKEYHEKVLTNLKKIAKQLIIVDVDDPQNSTFRSKLWNNYYVYLLGDQGDSFLTFNEFKKILNSEKFACYKLKTGVISTIKGNYFYASIKDQ